MPAKWIAPALVVVVLALTGCASQTPDEAYLSTVRGEVPALNDVADSELTGLGKSVCDLFEQQGFTVGMPSFVKSASDAGISAEGAGLIAGAATGTYCPEFSENF